MRYKQYRNLLSTLIKESIKSYFTNCFQSNLNDLKSTWEGIKNLIPLNELPNVAPSNIFDNGRSLAGPKEIANVFKNILLTFLLNFNLLLDTQKIIFIISSPN